MIKFFWIIYIICVPVFVVWAFREQIRRNRRWRLLELKFYLDDLYKMTCEYCKGTGYDGYTSDGEPNGEICEHCDSYGFVWRAGFPPEWLKHSNTWRQSEVDKLQQKCLSLAQKQGV